MATVLLFGLLSVGLAGGTSGCANRTTDRDIELLGVDAARSSTQAGDATAWLDPRTAGDWLTERIPGSLHVPVGTMRERAEELRGYELLVVYGRGYKDPVAYAAAKVLRDLGVPEVRVLEGGLTAWTAAGLEAASGTPRPDEGRGG